MSPDSKYWAFISYSHADAKFAQWLHKQLETFPVPRKLIGSETERGYQVPKRLFPIFRDREELPGSSNLADNINTALEQSRYLIVICSPRSAVSQWVNQEVMAFKAMGRADRVLCVIIDGEPNATDKPESGLLECFPPGVRYEVASDGKLSDQRAEPIAADARDGKDGKKDALIKLASGLLGVGFNTLKKREQIRKRRQKLLYAAASLMLIAGIATAGHKIWKEKERAKIEQERADLEAKISQAVNEFLLYELLGQADSEVQIISGLEPNPNVTVRELIRRSAEGLGGRFEDWRVEASIRHVIGHTAIAIGDYETAINILGDALELRSKHKPASDPETIVCMSRLAWAKHKSGKTNEAISIQSKAISLHKSNSDTVDLSMVNPMSNLALFYMSKGNFHEAIALLKKCLSMQRETLKPDDLRLACSTNNLAYAYQHSGESEKAAKLYSESMRIYSAHGLTDHPDALYTAVNIYSLKRSTPISDEDFSRRDALVKRLVQVLGGDHPDVLNSMNNLAIDYSRAGRVNESIELHQKVLQLRKKHLGEFHEHTISSMSNLAMAYERVGDMAKSILIGEKALDAALNHLGNDHPQTISCMSTLAWLHQSNQNLQRAIELYTMCVEHRKKSLGPDNPNTIRTLENLFIAHFEAENNELALKAIDEILTALDKNEADKIRQLSAKRFKAVLLRRLSRGEESEALFIETLNLLKEEAGPDHDQTLLAATGLAMTLEENGKTPEALKYYEEVFDLTNAKLGEEHPDSLWALQNLIQAYRSAGAADKALSRAQDYFKFSSKKYGATHPETLDAMRLLAASHRDADQLSQALKRFQQAHTVTKNELGIEHPISIATISGMALTLDKMGQRKEGLALLRETAKISDASLADVRYHLASLECLENNLDTAKQLITDEIKANPPSKQRALQDDNLKAIRDYIENL